VACCVREPLQALQARAGVIRSEAGVGLCTGLLSELMVMICADDKGGRNTDPRVVELLLE
jgi:hypothetical protein